MFFLIRKGATMIAKGSAASPGAACGKVCFTQDEALAAKANKEDAILVTVMTSQEDVKGMKAVLDAAAELILFSRNDADRFLPLYVDKEFFERHPFISIHLVPHTIVKMVRTFVADACVP